MQITAVRALVYSLAIAAPSLAQPALVHDKPTHVELSVGVASPADPLEGGYVLAHFDMSRHTMLGIMISSQGNSTVGLSQDGGQVFAYQSVLARGVLLSVRPVSWLKVGAGTAALRRTFRLADGDRLDEVVEETFNWIAGGEAKWVRGPVHPGGPPVFFNAVAQYRHVPEIESPRVRFSRWLLGVGLGVQF